MSYSNQAVDQTSHPAEQRPIVQVWVLPWIEEGQYSEVRMFSEQAAQDALDARNDIILHEDQEDPHPLISNVLWFGRTIKNELAQQCAKTLSDFWQHPDSRRWVIVKPDCLTFWADQQGISIYSWYLDADPTLALITELMDSIDTHKTSEQTKEVLQKMVERQKEWLAIQMKQVSSPNLA